VSGGAASAAAAAALAAAAVAAHPAAGSCSAAPRPPSRGFAHRRVAAAAAADDDPPQYLWIGFGGAADQPWLRPLRPGFRHCFAAFRDAAGWTVLDPLSGRLLVVRLAVPAGFDLPAAWRRAGFAVLGPFVPGPPRRRWLPPLAPFTCVALCRALLGAGAPFALTPRGLFRALGGDVPHRQGRLVQSRKKVLTGIAPAG
jgi:hypothetical protein